MKKIFFYIIVVLLTAICTAVLVAFLLNIRERKEEAKWTYVNVVPLDEKTIDPEVWGRNFPREYDGYKKTAVKTHTRYGGSEGISKLDEDPRLKTIFAGYAF